jgi:hypothetical protein
MRLSDAIAMGRVLIKLNPGLFLDPFCNQGCALGMGLAAVDGRKVKDNQERIAELWPWTSDICPRGSRNENTRFCERWSYAHEIGAMAYRVYEKLMSLDQLIDWVRSVEPEEIHVDTTSVEEVEYASMT